MAKPERNYDRLPKWVQDEIRVLRHNVEHWRDQALAAAGEEAGGAPIVVGIDPRDERGLPDKNIRFYPDPADRSRYIQVRLQGRGVDVNATRPVDIRPSSSNAIQIDIREDF